MRVDAADPAFGKMPLEQFVDANGEFAIHFGSAAVSGPRRDPTLVQHRCELLLASDLGTGQNAAAQPSLRLHEIHE
jgi:hypothetical protein